MTYPMCPDVWWLSTRQGESRSNLAPNLPVFPAVGRQRPAAPCWEQVSKPIPSIVHRQPAGSQAFLAKSRGVAASACGPQRSKGCDLGDLLRGRAPCRIYGAGAHGKRQPVLSDLEWVRRSVAVITSNSVVSFWA